MGKQGREARAVVKRLARAGGFKENELGELRQTKTKMDLRLEFLSRLEGMADIAIEAFFSGKSPIFYRFLQKAGKWEYLIVDILAKRAREEVCRAEDIQMFADIDAAVTLQLPKEVFGG